VLGREALLLCLARGAERGWEVIEEAALLHELSTRHSLGTLAERIGPDVSWVSRHLSLYRALPEELLEAVRAGRLSQHGGGGPHHVSVGARQRLPCPYSNLAARRAAHGRKYSTHRPKPVPVSMMASPRLKLGDDLLGYWIAVSE
jgi:hypothetical protein